MKFKRIIKVTNAVLVSLAMFAASIIAAPQLLAFPFKAQIGATTVYAEHPIPIRQMAGVLKRSDALLANTGIYTPPVGTRIFLTDGRWRWRVLSLTAHFAFALTRPASDLVSDAAIFNRSDPARDQIFNGLDERTRSLSGVIAHERTHMLVRRHFGMPRAVTLEQWKSEGYADHIAQESSLTQAEVDAFKKAGVGHWGIAYFEGRQRVAAIMAKNGNSVDQLFAR